MKTSGVEHGQKGLHRSPASSAGTVSLDSVLITSQIAQRPTRPPDYEAENRTLILLAKELANSPRNILQKLVEEALRLCKAQSAGVSLLEKKGGKEVFRWNAIVGVFAAQTGGSIAREESPCNAVINCNASLLFGYPERHYNYPIFVDPPIVEALVVPFHLRDKPVGTIWVIAHDDTRKFDAEDVRILQSLAEFTSSAFTALSALEESQLHLEERVRAEKELRNSEQHFRALVSASSDVIYRMSADWSEMRTLSGSGFLVDTHTPRQDWMQRYIPPQDRSAVLEAIRNAIRGKSLFELEHRVLRMDGSTGWTLSRAVPILDENGEIREWFGAATDVTARKLAEEAVKEVEARFRSFMDNSPTIAWIKDEQGRYIYLSKTFETRLGLRTEDRIGKTDLELWPEETARKFRENDLAVLRSNQPLEVIEETPDSAGGKLIWLNNKFPIVSDTTGQRFVAGIGIDITQRRRNEEAMIRSEKLASVGRMATTIAHEINNPLAAAVNAVFLASNTPGLPDSVRANLELADQELRQITHLTRQTLGFYRETASPIRVHLPELIDNILGLYKQKVTAKSVRIERRYRGESTVCVNKGELRQIAANIIGNGLDALGNSGILHIRTTPWTASRPMVKLTIADNGTGIRSENLTRIFEPFFTTKESFGTGLGLWVTKELVAKHEGQIRVRSRVGKGTVFSIWLPVERRKAESEHLEAA